MLHVFYILLHCNVVTSGEFVAKLKPVYFAITLAVVTVKPLKQLFCI
jgi:hypothetical protein